MAKTQIGAGAIGACVAKVSEAEMLVKAGLDRILITGPIASPTKVQRLVNLQVAVPFTM